MAATLCAAAPLSSVRSRAPCHSAAAAVPRHPARPAAWARPAVQRQQRGTAASARRMRVQAAAASTAAEIQELDKEFGIDGCVEVVAGLGGLPTVRLTHACGSSTEVSLFGGCITSWKQASGDEVLYLRPDALQILQSDNPKSKPISGGIPHCFPQFGPGAMQQHGFARNVDWSIATTSADPQPDDRDPEVTLLLEDSEYSRAMWPHKFKVAYSVALHGELLRVDMRVLNTDDKPFEFTMALHTYIEVADVEDAAVRGLKGLEYLDKTVDPANPARKTEEREEVTFSGPTDSVYLKARDHVELDVGTGAAVAITSNHLNDVVVWSPWTAMPDFYKHFVCVENAQFSSPVALAPGEFWRSQCEWAVRDL
ncbi:glucose-6-phosphate 1-epimerase [Micractinium conductrix]|uniref:glucose-6-phosphate 1-epimerase n=1 Tax=Micractinium conductrix TaxID=554055 RepID=A0A2P6VGX0_9CHLO|nr:glucose-6-phosphate 1-epimerase [Micractinium conductrix]|eukprot:PSC73327.1 glucose-6-phosphate 1-epimerase [Micractinium conductrix]